MKYLPDSFVTEVRVELVPTSVKVTVALPTAAPDGSVTVPATLPVPAICPMTDGEHTHTKARQQHNKATLTSLLNIELPPGWVVVRPPHPDQTCFVTTPKACFEHTSFLEITNPLLPVRIHGHRIEMNQAICFSRLQIMRPHATGAAKLPRFRF